MPFCRPQSGLLCSTNPGHARLYELAGAAAKNLGLATVSVTAPTSDDLEQAFEKMKQESCDAMFVLADLTRPEIVPLAAKSRLPAIYQSTAYVDLGGLASYGPRLDVLFRKVAQYVDRILKGADPAEFPVEQPVVFELDLNLKTAASLGLTVPDSVMARADKVVE